MHHTYHHRHTYRPLNLKGCVRPFVPLCAIFHTPGIETKSSPPGRLLPKGQRREPVHLKHLHARAVDRPTTVRAVLVVCVRYSRKYVGQSHTGDEESVDRSTTDQSTHPPVAPVAPLLRPLHAHVKGRLETLLRTLRVARVLRHHRREPPHARHRRPPLVRDHHFMCLSAPLVCRCRRQRLPRLRRARVRAADGPVGVGRRLARPQGLHLDLRAVGVMGMEVSDGQPPLFDYTRPPVRPRPTHHTPNAALTLTGSAIVAQGKGASTR